MGTIKEKNEWVDSIYLIELTDPVMGGEFGINNIQAKQLANRTTFLLAEFLKQHLSDGNHALSDQHVSPTAAISESKLDLNFTTTSLKEFADDGTELLNSINNRLDDILGVAGSTVSALGKAIPVAWGNSDRGFDFEMFSPIFTLIDEPQVAILQTVKGDDSIDVADTSNLKVDGHYVISSTAFTSSEVVQVKQILSSKRILAYTPVNITRTSGNFGLSSWNIKPGYALAKNGSRCVTKTITILKNSSFGKFIARLKSNGATIVPYYMLEGTNTWVKGTLIDTAENRPGYTDFIYRISGGVLKLRLDITCPSSVSEAYIDHLCVVPTETAGSLPDAVRKPIVISPANNHEGFSLTGTISVSDYRSLYEVPQKSVQLQVSSSGAFTSTAYNQTILGTQTSFTMPEGTLAGDTRYYIRCRQCDIENVWSKWSDTVVFDTENSSVSKPVNATPADASVGISSTPTLTASAFSAAPADTHIRSQWQLSLNSIFTSIVHDSGEVTNLVSYTVPSAILNGLSTYFWRVRYKGANNGWSDWSTRTRFSVLATGVYTPANLSPTNSATGISITPTLRSSVFASEPADTHIKSQWLVYSNSTYTTLVHDSGEVNNLVSYILPNNLLADGTQYYWKVRHKGTNLLWSELSNGSSFTTTVAASVDTPTNVSPANDARNISATTNLTSSAFDASPTDTHSKSQWQIFSDAGLTTKIHDSGESNSLLTYAVPSSTLTELLVYYWRVRHKGANNGWSGWSTATNFRVVGISGNVTTPVNRFPANNSFNNAARPALSATVFAASSADTHLASMWQVSLLADFSTIAHDSGEVTQLESYTLPSDLTLAETYYWRVRYKGQKFGWSSWSAATKFTVAPAAGEAVFTTPGIFNWVCPPGVTRVSAVCVGAGGGCGLYGSGSGGTLGWKNNISVVPGNSYVVQVGTNLTKISNSERHSKFAGMTAPGGRFNANQDSAAGNYYNRIDESNYTGCEGGGLGGRGGSRPESEEGWQRNGGGGAGGYTGNGGNAAQFMNGYVATPGTGGGGGGGGSFRYRVSNRPEDPNGDGSSGGSFWLIGNYTYYHGGLGGGGVGLFGVGANGVAGSSDGNSTWSYVNQGSNGGGGSGGLPGSGPNGGNFGGGSAMYHIDENEYGVNNYRGGSGAVRIIWGAGRSFPDNAQ